MRNGRVFTDFHRFILLTLSEMMTTECLTTNGEISTLQNNAFLETSKTHFNLVKVY